MTAKRIIKPTDYPWDPNYDSQPYSLAVERHGLLCISGLTAKTWSSQRGSYMVESTSLVKQTEVIFAKMGAILEAAGYTFADVVYTVDYALEPVMPEYRASGAVRRNAFGDSMPAAVGILVNGIPNSVSLMAVTAVAMRDGRHKRAVFPEGTPTWERYRSRTFWPGFFVGDDWFWLSGSTGRRFDPATGREGYRNGIETQAQDIWDSALGQVMRDAGVDADRIVKIFDYVHPAGVNGYPAASRNRGGLSTGSAATTAMPISRLLHRPALLETDALCYLGNDKEIIHIPDWPRDGHSPPASRPLRQVPLMLRPRPYQPHHRRSRSPGRLQRPANPDLRQPPSGPLRRRCFPRRRCPLPGVRQPPKRPPARRYRRRPP